MREGDRKRVYAEVGRRLLLILALLAMTAYGHGNAEEAGSGNVTPSILEMTEALTPLALAVLTPPHPVPGSDGLFHLVYELQVTNASSLRWRIESVTVQDAENPDVVVAAFPSPELLSKISLLGDKESQTTTFESNQSGIVWFHVLFKIHEAIPKVLVHYLVVSSEGGQLTETGGRTPVASEPAIVLGPPLRGTGWLAADGCCEAPRHIRALLPVNGSLHLAQRFAIDWERLNDEHRLFVGDPKDVKNYFAYGQEVLAVADARVVRAVDQFADRMPGPLPASIPLQETDGNHIILDLGNGRFALYAHLQPSSVQVQVGDQVRRGQILARVGNPGNTTAPHLHFHVMSAPLSLASNGLPYVIDTFDLMGRVGSTAEFDKAERDGIALNIRNVENPGRHQHELPLDLSVVSFP
jgi:Peptidase family M23